MPRFLYVLLLTATWLAAGSPARDANALFFVENTGEVRFVARASGLTAYFEASQAVVHSNGTTVTIRYEGANPSPRIETEEPWGARANFLVGPPEQWHTGLAMYGRIVYRDLYPGIDLVYSGQGRNLKSEFVVAPGADPARIRVRYTGPGRTRISEAGELVVPVEGHELREEAPLIYQERGGARAEVAGRFTVGPDGTVGFIVNRYDRTQPLVIDPLVYSTYLGGSNSDAATGIQVDATGAAYVAGYTASINFPTLNPRQSTSAGSNEVFVAKLNAAGTGLVYSTYIGGSGDDRALGLAVNEAGEVTVVGSTTSTNFPLQGAMQTRRNGAKNAFALKLNAAGNGLIYSTYIGGSGSDAATGVALDASGNAYLAGNTTSLNFPATALQKSNRGSQDGFAAKLTASGTLEWSTYLGGSLDDQVTGVAVDAGGTVYVTGATYSTDFPVASAYQDHSAGGQDAFVARLNATGTALLYSTYLGGSMGGLGAPEVGQGIAVDAAGNAYVAGTMSSGTFPGAPAPVIKRQDAFVSKLSPSGALVYSVCIGGSGWDTANAVRVDAGGNAWVAGYTISSDLPVVNAVQSAAGGDYDAFFAKVAPAGDAVLLLSYLGGHGSDTATALAVSGAGDLYLAGYTLSSDFPVSSPYQSLNAGLYGAFVAKVAPGTPPQVGTMTPNAGSGASQTFQWTFTDAAGASNLSSASILFQTSANVVNACAVTYDRAANRLMLLSDAGAAGSSITPGSGTLANTQCTVQGSGSSVTAEGNVLTVTLAITFQSGFVGARNVYGQAANGSGTTGWQQVGTWTVTQALPEAVSVTPNAGSGTSQTFSFLYRDPRGASAIQSVSVTIGNTAGSAGSCYLLYYRGAKALYLANDAATGWPAYVTVGQSGTLANSQCSVDAALSSAVANGNDLTLNLAITFQSSFSGTKDVYMRVYDGSDSGWQLRGNWGVPAAAAPTVVSVTPSSGSGATQTFSVQARDSRGYAMISTVSLLVNSTASGVGGCLIQYDRSTNAISLSNDSNTGWLGPVVSGQAASLQNSQCSVNAAGSWASGSDATLTVNFMVNFFPAFNGTRNLYGAANNGLDSGWSAQGTWTVAATALFGPVSVTPSSGSGASQTFSFTFTDSRGAGYIQSVSILINGTQTWANGCYLLYYRGAKALYLANNAGTSWLTSVTVGQSGTTANSQCSVNAGASSVTAAGNNLTLNLAITFSSSFKGAKNVYMEAYSGIDSGWQWKGNWNIP